MYERIIDGAINFEYIERESICTRIDRISFASGKIIIFLRVFHYQACAAFTFITLSINVCTCACLCFFLPGKIPLFIILIIFCKNDKKIEISLTTTIIWPTRIMRHYFLVIKSTHGQFTFFLSRIHGGG